MVGGSQRVSCETGMGHIVDIYGIRLGDTECEHKIHWLVPYLSCETKY